jgi:peptidoglycan/LPS O-acetylase OafA/YrhL
MLFSSTRILQFRRITTQKRFIPQIDGLLFVAIASVIFFHIYAALEIGAIPQPIPFNTDLAKRGVELFYGISGFILGVPFVSRYLLQAPRVSLKQYFLRRLTRLEPPYFLSLIAWATMQFVVAHRSLSKHGAAPGRQFRLLIQPHFRRVPRGGQHCPMVPRGRGPVLCASPALVDVICHR